MMGSDCAMNREEYSLCPLEMANTCQDTGCDDDDNDDGDDHVDIIIIS
jgi:hypothetical protein